MELQQAEKDFLSPPPTVAATAAVATAISAANAVAAKVDRHTALHPPCAFAAVTQQSKVL